MALTQVKSDGIATGAVTATQIAANAVTVDDISDGSISTAKLADDAVTADKLADTAVTAGTYGSDTAIPAITVDAQGRITAASTNAISVESDRIFEGNTSAEAVDTGSDGHFKVITEGTEALRITAAQRVGIINTNPGAALEVSSGDRNSSGQGGTITVGGDSDSTGVSNNQRKIGFINVPHYANATAKMALMIGDCQSSSNEISIGGSYSNYTAATAIKFWTAANNTTTVGTERMRINSSGDIGINGTTNPNYHLTFANTSSRNAGIDYTSGSDDTNLDIISAGPSGGWKGRIRFFTSFSGTATEGMRLDENRNLQFNSGYGSVATAYGVRAWVNYDGTGTPSIRGSGRVSSITDIAAGRKRVNFASDMPDANYAVVVSMGDQRTGYNSYTYNPAFYNFDAGHFYIATYSDSTWDDYQNVSCAVIR